jgi:hypothetical protein
MGAEHEPVVALVAGQDVVAAAADQYVVALAAVENVVAVGRRRIGKAGGVDVAEDGDRPRRPDAMGVGDDPASP